jgi:hypothetical protein
LAKRPGSRFFCLFMIACRYKSGDPKTCPISSR